MNTAMLGERLIIANRADELRRMSRWLGCASARMGLAANEAFNLDVCANAAVFNIISYAYDDDQPHEITLDLTRTDTGVRLTIRDSGKPFNPLTWPAHQGALRLEEARAGGLGIHLLRQLAPGSAYRRINGINELSLDAWRDSPRRDA